MWMECFTKLSFAPGGTADSVDIAWRLSPQRHGFGRSSITFCAHGNFQLDPMAPSLASIARFLHSFSITCFASGFGAH